MGLRDWDLLSGAQWLSGRVLDSRPSATNTRPIGEVGSSTTLSLTHFSKIEDKSAIAEKNSWIFLKFRIITYFQDWEIEIYCRERTGSVVECLSRDRVSVGSSLAGATELCPWARHVNPGLVMVLPSKTRPYITEILLMWLKDQIMANN